MKMGLAAFSQRSSHGTHRVLAVGGWQVSFCRSGGYGFGPNRFSAGFGLGWLIVLKLR